LTACAHHLVRLDADRCGYFARTPSHYVHVHVYHGSLVPVASPRTAYSHPRGSCNTTPFALHGWILPYALFLVHYYTQVTLPVCSRLSWLRGTFYAVLSLFYSHGYISLLAALTHVLAVARTPFTAVHLPTVAHVCTPHLPAALPTQFCFPVLPAVLQFWFAAFLVHWFTCAAGISLVPPLYARFLLLDILSRFVAPFVFVTPRCSRAHCFFGFMPLFISRSHMVSRRAVRFIVRLLHRFALATLTSRLFCVLSCLRFSPLPSLPRSPPARLPVRAAFLHFGYTSFAVYSRSLRFGFLSCSCGSLGCLVAFGWLRSGLRSGFSFGSRLLFRAAPLPRTPMPAQFIHGYGYAHARHGSSRFSRPHHAFGSFMPFFSLSRFSGSTAFGFWFLRFTHCTCSYAPLLRLYAFILHCALFWFVHGCCPLHTHIHHTVLPSYHTSHVLRLFCRTGCTPRLPHTVTNTLRIFGWFTPVPLCTVFAVYYTLRVTFLHPRLPHVRCFYTVAHFTHAPHTTPPVAYGCVAHFTRTTLRVLIYTGYSFCTPRFARFVRLRLGSSLPVTVTHTPRTRGWFSSFSSVGYCTLPPLTYGTFGWHVTACGFTHASGFTLPFTFPRFHMQLRALRASHFPHHTPPHAFTWFRWRTGRTSSLRALPHTQFLIAGSLGFCCLHGYRLSFRLHRAFPFRFTATLPVHTLLVPGYGSLPCLYASVAIFIRIYRFSLLPRTLFPGFSGCGLALALLTGYFAFSLVTATFTRLRRRSRTSLFGSPVVGSGFSHLPNTTITAHTHVHGFTFTLVFFAYLVGVLPFVFRSL